MTGAAFVAIAGFGALRLVEFAVGRMLGSGAPLYQVSAWLDKTDPSQVVLILADRLGDEKFWDGIRVKALPLGADEWSPLVQTTLTKQRQDGSAALVAAFPQQLAVGSSILVSVDTPWGHHWESPQIVLEGEY